MEPYENLANAIVLQAVRDYREALARAASHSAKDCYQRNKADLERFFRSGWFGVLTNLDLELLIGRLNQEVVV
jgi:hypothetical protein